MSRLSNRDGFSVTELLISVVVIAVGVVGLTSAVGLASTEMRLGKRDTELSMLVTDQLETLKASDHDSVVSGQRVEGPYTLTWNIQGNEPKRVVLVAQYENADGSPKADTVVTYLSR